MRLPIFKWLVRCIVWIYNRLVGDSSKKIPSKAEEIAFKKQTLERLNRQRKELEVTRQEIDELDRQISNHESFLRDLHQEDCEEVTEHDAYFKFRNHLAEGRATVITLRASYENTKQSYDELIAELKAEIKVLEA